MAPILKSLFCFGALTAIACLLFTVDANARNLSAPPVADAGADQVVECGANNGTPVGLDGTGSFDADGDPLTYSWTGPFPEGGGTVSGATPVVTLELGVHSMTLTVTDPDGASDSDEVEVTIEDTTDPEIWLVGPSTMTLECGLHQYWEHGAWAADACDRHPEIDIGGNIGGIPRAFEYAILTDLQLDIRGDVFVHSLNDFMNASIHSNSILDVRGNSVVVEGYGTWTEGVSRQTKEENFVPRTDWNGDQSNVFYEPYVDIPTIDMQALHDAATNRVIGEDFTIDGDEMGGPMTFYDWAVSITPPGLPPPPEDIGTEKNPFILFVGADEAGNGGNLFIQNDVQLAGYGILVAQGNVFIDPMGAGNGIGGQLHGLEVTLAVRTVGFIDVVGSPSIVASMHAKCDTRDGRWGSVDRGDCGYIEFHGLPEVTGGFVADETFFSGAGVLQVNFAPPSGAVLYPNLSTDLPGEYTLTYTATDDSGNSSEVQRTVIIEDTYEPWISVNAEPLVLWPPNRKYEQISLDDLGIQAYDLCERRLTGQDVIVAQVTSDEVENGADDGNTTDDIVIPTCRQADLRRERQGSGDGRVYTLEIAVADASGNVGLDELLVQVPVNKNLKLSPVAGPVAYSVDGCDPLTEVAPRAVADGNPDVELQTAAATEPAFSLDQNYPNPFNPATTIRFGLPKASHVTLTVHDLLGRRVATLVDKGLAAGFQTVTWDASALPSGSYLYVLKAGEQAQRRQMLLAK